ncbi:MAG: AI-2E family transporter [Syntrophobacterales bacterium]|nr:MAG: AI-2E family transporter [Syntrophobacterales bacterium]
MERKHFSSMLIIFLIILSCYLFYVIFSPFLIPIIWAIILAIVFYPVYRGLNHRLKGRKSFCALVMTSFVVLLIVFPSAYMLSMLANEAISAYAFFETGLETGRFQSILGVKDHPIIQGLWHRLNQYVDLSELDINSLLLENLRMVSTFAMNQTSRIIKGFSFIIINFCLVIISLYYVFKDGDQLLRKVREAIPLAPQDKNLLFNRLEEMVYATLYGGVLVALLQGFLGGFAFWFLGLSSPIFWGTVMAFLSFVPIIGSFLVWGPVVVYFFFQGSLLKGIVLMVWGGVVVGLSDNFLRPILISKRTKLHTMLLFFGVLGGIKSFGLLGLIVGPLVVTICITALDIYLEKTAQTAQSAA